MLKLLRDSLRGEQVVNGSCGLKVMARLFTATALTIRMVQQTYLLRLLVGSIKATLLEHPYFTMPDQAIKLALEMNKRLFRSPGYVRKYKSKAPY